MAWYEGTYSCGHDGRTNVIGKVSERDYWINREFEKSCPDCREKERNKKIEKESSESFEASRKLGLSALTGSEKQIAWAITLRQKFVEDWKETRKEFIEALEDEQNKIEHPAEWEAAKGNLIKFDAHYYLILKNETSSKFWIDNRTEGAKRLIWDNVKREEQLNSD